MKALTPAEFERVIAETKVPTVQDRLRVE